MVPAFTKLVTEVKVPTITTLATIVEYMHTGLACIAEQVKTFTFVNLYIQAKSLMHSYLAKKYLGEIGEKLCCRGLNKVAEEENVCGEKYNSKDIGGTHSRGKI